MQVLKMADYGAEVHPMLSSTSSCHQHEVIITPEFTEALHLEILSFARCTRPSVERRLQVISGFDSVRGIVKMLWPEGDLEIYGSFGTGLCMCHSDVDLCVVNVPKPEDMSDDEASKWMLQRLAHELDKQEWCHSMKPIPPRACVSVLKFLYGHKGDSSQNESSNSTTAKLISMDISIGGLHSHTLQDQEPLTDKGASEDLNPKEKFMKEHTGAACREYVLQKIQELPPLAPLVLILKTFLDHQGLSIVYSGGLGAFSLTLLVIFYLERVKVAASRQIPHGFSPKEHGSSASFECSSASICVGSAADALDKVITFLEEGDSPSLGTLLLGFLRTFGFEIQLTSQKVVIKGLDGARAWGFFDREDKSNTAPWIDNPLMPNVNVAQSSFNISKVQEAFRDLLHALIRCGAGGQALKYKCDVENSGIKAIAFSYMHNMVKCGVCSRRTFLAL